MKLSLLVRFSGNASALIVAVLLLASSTKLAAQTTFLANGISGSTSGAHANVFATNFDPLFNFSGPTSNNITGQTFGNGFSIVSTASGASDDSFIIGGTIGGSTLTAGTSLSIFYDFNLSKNAFVNGDVLWSLKFSDSINNPSGALGTSTLVASGTLSSASSILTGTGTYNLPSNLNAGDSFRVFIETSYSGTIGLNPPQIDGVMTGTAFGGQGVTISASAVPEPSTYAALCGLSALGFATWRRRKTSEPRLA